MQRRTFVTVVQIDKANMEILEMLNKRLMQKGRHGYIGTHETLGIIAEEYDELKDAARTDDVEEFIRELKDIAVACWFGIASLRQNEIAEQKDPGPDPGEDDPNADEWIDQNEQHG